ncbi:MAG: hypothetical protein K6E54_06275 [Bacteroidaceae bacterium]|nr:hypothetical protein [Bacteroidaceae bacterium]
MKIKRKFVVAILFICTSFFSSIDAQNVDVMPNNEITIDLGLGITQYTRHMDNCAAYKQFRSNVSIPSNKKFGDKMQTSVNIMYIRNINKKFGVGLQAGIGFLKTDDFSDKKTYGKIAKIKEHNIYLMPTFRTYWYNTNNIGVYSRVSVGLAWACYDEEDTNGNDNLIFACGNESSVKFAFQASAIGFEWGGELARGFVEAGYGGQGILITGLKIRF